MICAALGSSFHETLHVPGERHLACCFLFSCFALEESISALSSEVAKLQITLPTCEMLHVFKKVGIRLPRKSVNCTKCQAGPDSSLTTGTVRSPLLSSSSA